MGAIYLLVVVAIIAIVVAAWYFSHDTTVRRTLRNARVRKIAELGDGVTGRIVGAAKPYGDNVLIAPLTKRRCLYYIARVEERHTHGKTSSWRTLIKEEQGVEFIVEDDSGRAIVDPMNARISLEPDSHSRSGMFDDADSDEKAFLDRHSQSGQAWSWFFNRTLRYIEAVIAEDEVISVLGAGVREPDPDAPPADAYRGVQPTVLRLEAGAYELLISDAQSTTGSPSTPGD